MKVAVVQSSFLPWMGFFDLINSVDKFVFYDDVQYTKNDWRNRNRIRVAKNWVWLTVPVDLPKAHFHYRICDVQINNNLPWAEKHLNALLDGYRKTHFFNEYFSEIKNILCKRHSFLIDLNYEFIFKTCEYLGINMNKFMFSQDMIIPADLSKTDRLVYLLDKIGPVDEYISGPAERAYLEVDKLNKKGVRVNWHEYQHPYYNQALWGSDAFISHLSVLDLLFSHGKESLDIIIKRKKIQIPDSVRMVNPQEYKMEALV